MLPLIKAVNNTKAANSEGNVGGKNDDEEGGDAPSGDKNQGTEDKSQEADVEQLAASMFVLNSGEVFSTHNYIAMVGPHLSRHGHGSCWNDLSLSKGRYAGVV